MTAAKSTYEGILNKNRREIYRFKIYVSLCPENDVAGPEKIGRLEVHIKLKTALIFVHITANKFS